MSKTICDVCGTSYDETAGTCPVCGWNQSGELPADIGDFDADFLDDFQMDAPAAAPEKPAPAKPVAPVKPAAAKPAAPAEQKKTAFDYDAANKRRRPAAKAEAPKSEEEEEEEEEESGSNTFLVIILVLLILALLAVSAYIGWTKILKPRQMGSETNKPQETISAITEAPTEAVLPTAAATEATEPEIPCTSLEPVGTMDKLTFKGQYWRLMVKAEPENTTEKIIYTSGDEKVVTIDEYGRVTAVGEGETTIVITCGSQRIEIPATVSFQTETTAATEANQPTTAGATATATPISGATTTTTATGTLKLKKTDITLNRIGVYFTLELEGGITADDVDWTTSDSSVANVYNGKVTALGRGVCIVTAEYNGQTAQCVVRCKF